MEEIKPDFQVYDEENGWEIQFNKELRLERTRSLYRGEWLDWSEWKKTDVSFTVEEFIEAMQIPENLKPYIPKLIDLNAYQKYIDSGNTLPGGVDATLNWLTLLLPKAMSLYIQDITEQAKVLTKEKSNHS